MIIKLDKSFQTIEELVKVHQKYGENYDQEKAYSEEIDFAHIAKQERIAR